MANAAATSPRAGRSGAPRARAKRAGAGRARERLKPPYPPMEARSVLQVPTGDQWQYEPKWDGFRCLVFRTGKGLYLQSKSGRPLARYFPDVVAAVERLPGADFVLDGEIVIPVSGRLSFDELLLRVHPAASRVRTLADLHPAVLVVFDLLADDAGEVLVDQPLSARRPRLERFARRFPSAGGAVRLSPATTDPRRADRWFHDTGGNLDGVIAKRLDLPYRAGERDGMQKVKHRRTADCVVGGYRLAAGLKVIGSLLLGLYDRDGALHHVGFTSSFPHAERAGLTRLVQPYKAASSFTGRAPGGPSRWSKRDSDEWQPLEPRLVVEVAYDHFTGGRFRHGTTLVRWRADKKPRECTLDQVERTGGSTLDLIAAPRARKSPPRTS
jgi:ATP-dependent DNA ligase